MRNSIIAALGGIVLSTFPFADDPADGFDIQSLPYPGGSLTATLADGDVLAFDGATLDRYDVSGTYEATLTTFSPAVWTGLLAVDPGETYALVGESTTGAIYRVDLTLGGRVLLATLANNYDADFEDPSHAVISAAACGFGCGNELHRLDTTTGVTTLLVTVLGSSGPVAVESDGDLLYGIVSDAFPPPAGASSVLRWDAAVLTGNPVLTETEATIVGAGYEAVGSLAIDPVDGRVYVTENDFNTGLNRIREVNGPAAGAPVLIEGTSWNWITNLEFRGGDGVALFRPYQPEAGGQLLYTTTDFVLLAERNELRPERPYLTLAGAGTTGSGDVDFTLHAGVPGGMGWIYYGPSSLYSPTELPLWLNGGGHFLFVGLDLGTLRADSGLFLLDGEGSGGTTLDHDGTLLGQVAFQALVLDGASPRAISRVAFL